MYFVLVKKKFNFQYFMISVNFSDKINFFLFQSILIIVTSCAVYTSGWTSVYPSIIASLFVTICSSTLCLFAIPGASELLINANLFGRDCHKKNSPKIPEAMGVVVGFAYVIGLTIFIPFENELGERLSMFLSALLSINSMCFLGFVDNVLNLRWRHKLLIPLIASLPVIIVYYTQKGSTFVLLPDYIVGGNRLAVDFGIWFYVFLSMLSVFGTNAINILAGINGLEIGQSILLTTGMIVNSLIQMNRHGENWGHDGGFKIVFCLYLLLPFWGCSVALWIFNKYPSRVFVGDSYCYLAGTVLAVAGILGHCSKTMLLFMMPQVVNFLYSIPQLFRIIPCPRHRMPAYVPDRDLVDISYTDWIKLDEVGRLTRIMVKMIEVMKLAKVERNKSGAVRVSNLTLINFTIWKIGRPLNEGTLTNIILVIQTIWIAIAFVIRYKAAALVYSIVD